MRPCLFCGSTSGRATNEHVIPKWARDAFAIQGPITIHATDPGGPREVAGTPAHLNIRLRGRICARCNNEWLAGLEQRVEPVLAPMAVSAKPTVLGAAEQALLATWAVKTVWLFALAIRQQYPRRQPVGWYEASEPEFTWLWANSAPPPRALVWLGCWDCQQATPVNFEPSEAPLPTTDGHPVIGHLTTFTLGYVAFQVFTVDFVATEQHGARAWNPEVPPELAQALIRIWPGKHREVSWPPQAFARGDWQRMVTWNGSLRSS
jgi:hypothetical protein